MRGSILDCRVITAMTRALPTWPSIQRDHSNTANQSCDLRLRDRDRLGTSDKYQNCCSGRRWVSSIHTTEPPPPRSVPLRLPDESLVRTTTAVLCQTEVLSAERENQGIQSEEKSRERQNKTADSENDSGRLQQSKNKAVGGWISRSGWTAGS